MKVKVKPKFKELLPFEQCPCGSRKTYQQCCKQKNFQYGRVGDRIVKKVFLDGEAQHMIKEQQARFYEYYGRMPENKDYLLNFVPVYDDEFLVQMVYTLRECGIAENKVYAYYKTGGIMPASVNLDNLSDVDIAEFQCFCDEYTAKINAPIKDKINTLQFVELSNKHIYNELFYIENALINTCYDLIHRHTEVNQPLAFYTKDSLDFCIFSALKTVKTVRSIQQLEKNHLPECIYALGRSIFENYMYLCAINTDPVFFQSKILPMIDEESYELIIEATGRISRKKALEKATGQELNIKVNVAELKKYFISETDNDLYYSFYCEACQYVHVDIVSAKQYFSVIDIYDRIDPTLIAGVVVATIALMLLQQISECSLLQKQYKKDLQFLLASLGKKLATCLIMADSDTENRVHLVSLLLKRLSEYGYTTDDTDNDG